MTDQASLPRPEEEHQQAFPSISLDEAIDHCLELAAGDCQRAIEHRQLGAWLCELKLLREQKHFWQDALQRAQNEVKRLREDLDQAYANEPKVRWELPKLGSTPKV